MRLREMNLRVVIDATVMLPVSRHGEVEHVDVGVLVSAGCCRRQRLRSRCDRTRRGELHVILAHGRARLIARVVLTSSSCESSLLSSPSSMR